MHAGRVACAELLPLVSHVEYARRIMVGKKANRQLASSCGKENSAITLLDL